MARKKKSLKDIHKAVHNKTMMLPPHERRMALNKRNLKVQKLK